MYWPFSSFVPGCSSSTRSSTSSAGVSTAFCCAILPHPSRNRGASECQKRAILRGYQAFPRFAWHRPRQRTNLQFDAWLWMTAKMGRLDGILKDRALNQRDEAFDPRLWRVERRFWAGEAILEDIVQSGQPVSAQPVRRALARCGLRAYPCLRRTVAGRPGRTSRQSLRWRSATTLPRDTTARRSGRRRSASIGLPASSTTRLANAPGPQPVVRQGS